MLSKSDFQNKIKSAYKILESCKLCPRECKVNRLKGELGICKIGRDLVVSSYAPHFGEEPCLVGTNGSGTIFLTGCNLKCIFCQNYDISHLNQGQEYTLDRFAQVMLNIEKLGCHNINFVTPTHFAPQIIEAIFIAKEKGLQIPIVWNCGGYESLEVIKILEGIVDIYMPDAKLFDNKVGKEFCNVDNYKEVISQTLIEMQRQVGDLECDHKGISQKGLLIRHLVMPEDQSSSRELLDFISEKVSKNAHINIMDQYRPCFKAIGHPKIGRMIISQEFQKAYEYALNKGLKIV